jgi:hypothetical protein
LSCMSDMAPFSLVHVAVVSREHPATEAPLKSPAHCAT